MPRDNLVPIYGANDRQLTNAELAAIRAAQAESARQRSRLADLAPGQVAAGILGQQNPLAQLIGFLQEPVNLAETFGPQADIKDMVDSSRAASQNIARGNYGRAAIDLASIPLAAAMMFMPGSLGQLKKLAEEHQFRSGAVRDDPRRFPGSTLVQQRQIADLDAGLKVDPVPGAATTRPVSIEDLEGATLIPLAGDRTNIGTLRQIEGQDLETPIFLQGGKGYMQLPGTGVWASDQGVIKRLAGLAERVENPIGIYSPMAGKGSDFAKMTTDVALRDFDPKSISKKDRTAIEKAIRSGTGIDAAVPDFPAIDSPAFWEAIANNPGKRKAFLQAIDSKAAREMGFPDVGVARHAITSPDLLYLPNVNDPLVGQAVARLEPGLGIRPTADLPIAHGTYPTDLPGTYLGALAGTPRSLVFRDWYNMRRAAGAPESRDSRSFQFSNITQEVDPELVDTVMRYQELVKANK